MVAPPIPKDEEDRLATLRDYKILDTLPEEVFDRLVAIASEVCRTPIALFSLVDEKRQWFKARVGLEVEETARELSFCAHAIAANHELLVDDTLHDVHFVDNALVIGTPNIRFYYGVPVRSHGGHPLGTLCVIDRVPRKLTDQQRVRLGELARQVETHLELRRINQDLNLLMDERAVMSSMIAHDARNLMTRVVGELELLAERAVGEDAANVQRSQEAVGQLLRMCENFVSLNDGSEGPMIVPMLTPTDLGAWFAALVRRESQRAWRESVTIEDHFDLDPPPLSHRYCSTRATCAQSTRQCLQCGSRRYFGSPSFDRWCRPGAGLDG